MAISKKIINYLSQVKYKYELVEHKTVYTAWDKAQTEKTKPQAITKTLAVRLDNDYVLVLLPANRNLDKIKLLKVINNQRKKNKEKVYKKLELAKEAWMKKNLPGKMGAIPPFRAILKKDIFIDSLLLKNKKIYLGTGEYTQSFLISVNQYLKNEQPIKGTFSKKK